jgi:O-antigen/teichoic acid export membrane protein
MSTESALPDAEGDRLVKSAVALLISSATGAVLGVVFWAVATHLFPAVDVGYGVAEIAAMTFIASAAQLNVTVVFPRFLFAAGARAAVILRAGYAASITLALVVGVAFLTLTGHHDYIARGTAPALLFLAAVVLWVVFTIEDAALTGMRKTFWVPVENTSFSVVKILLLPIFALTTPLSGVFLSWILPVIGCIIPINYYLFRKVLPAHVAWSAGRSSLPAPRAVGSMLAGEYFGGLAVIAMGTLPALLIVAKLGAVQTAYFQTPWLVGTSFDFLLWSIAASLIVESSARPTVARDAVRKAVRLALWLLTPALVVLVAGAPILLEVLGGTYSQHGTPLLRCLALTLPFMGVNVLYVTFARMARRIRRIVVAQLGISALVIALTALLIGPMGITGAGVAFLAGEGITALIVLPSVVRQYRHQDMAPGFAPDAALVALGVTRSDAGVDSPVTSPDGTQSNGAWRIGFKRSRRLAEKVDGPQKRSSRAIVSMILLAADLIALAMTIGDLHGPVRLACGLALGVVIPGWSVVGPLKLENAALEVGLTVAVSLALLMLSAQVLMTINAWHLVALQEATCLICLPSLIWQSRDHRRARESSR